MTSIEVWRCRSAIVLLRDKGRIVTNPRPRLLGEFDTNLSQRKQSETPNSFGSPRVRRWGVDALLLNLEWVCG